jgi:hypothetical protein
MKYFCCIEYDNGQILDTVESNSRRDIHKKARECLASWNKSDMTAVLFYEYADNFAVKVDTWRLK